LKYIIGHFGDGRGTTIVVIRYDRQSAVLTIKLNIIAQVERITSLLVGKLLGGR